MHFSVITPQDGQLRQAVHELSLVPGSGRSATPYAEHQWLWRFFPSEQDQRRDFIFRRYDLDGTPRFYVVSQRPPEELSTAWNVRTQSYAPLLNAGQRLSFELLANPVVSKKDATGKSRRHDVVMQAKKDAMDAHGVKAWKDWTPDEGRPDMYTMVQEECLRWLEARGLTNGFSIVSARVEEYQQKIAGARAIRFSTVNFTGELEVTDALLFEQALFNGIGHAKAFGCGLFLVHRMEG